MRDLRALCDRLDLIPETERDERELRLIADTLGWLATVAMLLVSWLTG